MLTNTLSLKCKPVKTRHINYQHENNLCGPRIFGSCIFHSMVSSIFIWKNWFLLIKKNDLESPLIFVLFLKGKQNKKEKP